MASGNEVGNNGCIPSVQDSMEIINTDNKTGRTLNDVFHKLEDLIKAVISLRQDLTGVNENVL